jgi:hypothetical protein
MKKTITVINILLSVLLFACNGTESKKTTDTPKDSVVEKAEETEKPEKNTQNPDNQADTPESISQKLQGKWRSLDDPKSFIEFKGEYRVDIYGQEEDAKEKFSIAKECPESENPNLKSDKFEYIVSGDMCWSIDSLDTKKLVLMYTARGNILRYEKIKD